MRSSPVVTAISMSHSQAGGMHSKPKSRRSPGWPVAVPKRTLEQPLNPAGVICFSQLASQEGEASVEQEGEMVWRRWRVSQDVCEAWWRGRGWVGGVRTGDARGRGKHRRRKIAGQEDITAGGEREREREREREKIERE